MNNKTLQILEYNKIKDLLAEHASSQLGKTKCASLHPLRNREAILDSLQNTDDAVARVLSAGRLNANGNTDLTECYRALFLEATLGISELLQVASACESAKREVTDGLTL